MPPQMNNKRKRALETPARKQGGKRTQEDLEQASLDPVQQEASLKSYMFHANKILHKACKKAKTFEVQKLTRKIKTTREPKEGKPIDESTLKDLELQLVSLKSLSIDPIPPHILLTRLPKHPSLHSLPFLPQIISSIPSSKPQWTELDGQSVEGKARNRVLANKSLSEGWEEVQRGVRKRLGEIVEPVTVPGTKSVSVEEKKVGGEDLKGKGKEEQGTETVTEEKGEREGGEVKEKRLSKRAERALKAAETKKNLPKRTMEMSKERQEALALLSRGDDGASEGDTEEGSEDEGPVMGSEAEELDDDEIERELREMNEGLSGSQGEWSGSEDEDEGLDSGGFASDVSQPSPPQDARPTKRSKLSVSPRPPTEAKKQKIREIPNHKPVTSSAFLPSLAAGYVSYSDSDGEDAKWVKAAERENKKGERKNRRGQRARQAIWEKKFGSAAAHVVKAGGGKPVPLDKLKKNKKAIKSGEPVPRTKSDKPVEPEKPFDPAHAPGGSANPNAQPIAPRKVGYGAAAAVPKTEGEKMHPSWEAKRKQAEALKTVQPQGKKITFD
ncbi:hypothetical protein JCM16303_006523 [Sporobolomyces ruberrimus]